MTAPTPESVELAKKRLAQAKARLDALNARIATEGRRLDTRRKIILGGLLLDAATKDQRFAGIVSELPHRISRDQDRKPFEGWTLPGADRCTTAVGTTITAARSRAARGVLCSESGRAPGREGRCLNVLYR